MLFSYVSACTGTSAPVQNSRQAEMQMSVQKKPGKRGELEARSRLTLPGCQRSVAARPVAIVFPPQLPCTKKLVLLCSGKPGFQGTPSGALGTRGGRPRVPLQQPPLGALPCATPRCRSPSRATNGRAAFGAVRLCGGEGVLRARPVITRARSSRRALKGFLISSQRQSGARQREAEVSKVKVEIRGQFCASESN